MNNSFKKIKDLQFDVVVIGGGLSGICAAVAAARNGAKTALIHARHVLGGNASSEIKLHINGASDNFAKPDYEETGLLYEMMLENKAINDYFNYSTWDLVLYSFVKKEPNLTTFYNTVMDDCIVENNIIKSITAYQQTTEIRYNFYANIFIDCTGNGTLGYLSGAEFTVGSESKYKFNEPDAPEQEDNNCMGNTLFFKAIDRGTPTNFKRPDFAKVFTEEDLKYRPHVAQKVQKSELITEDYLRVTSFSASMLDFGYWWIELSGKNDIISEYENIRDDLVACVYGVWDHIKNQGEHYAENYDLEWVGMLPGTRESRRLIGDYVLTENDVLNNKQFEDAVAYGGWPMDVHTKNGLYDFDKLPTRAIAFDGIYTIPYRCYYSKNINNLFMAGRNISTSKLAFSSSRVMGTCAIGGQAVGTAAALCMKYQCLPRALNNRIHELQQLLLKDDQFIPNVKNKDGNDYAKTATITASTYQDGYEPINIINGIARELDNQSNMWKSCPISDKGETITLAFKQEQIINQVRLTFDSNLHKSIRITPSKKRQQLQKAGVPIELVKDYSIKLIKNNNVVCQKDIHNNILRLNIVNFESITADKIEVTIHSTNGDNCARIFEIRAY